MLSVIPGILIMITKNLHYLAIPLVIVKFHEFWSIPRKDMFSIIDLPEHASPSGYAHQTQSSEFQDFQQMLLKICRHLAQVSSAHIKTRWEPCYDFNAVWVDYNNKP